MYSITFGGESKEVTLGTMQLRPWNKEEILPKRDVTDLELAADNEESPEW